MRATTYDDYQQRLGRVVEHIETHLDAPLSVDALAKVASFSPFHFHRIFRGMVGETVKSYVKRLRLERAAFALNSTDRKVTEVALAAGYESHEAFTRAFRARFGCAPRAYAASDAATRSRAFEAGQPTLTVEVKQRRATTLAYVRCAGTQESIGAAFETLYAFVGADQLRAVGGPLGISYDDPVVTAPPQLRFDAAAIIGPDRVAEGDVKIRELPAGPYAVARYQGPYTEMHGAYVELVGKWFPRSGYEPEGAGCLEFYRNEPQSTAPEDLLTDIWVPIAP